VDFIEVVFRGGRLGFEQIIRLIDELTAKLKEEQAEDDEKKGRCETEIDKTEDTKKVLQQDISDLETAINDAEESINIFSGSRSSLMQDIERDEKMEKF